MHSIFFDALLLTLCAQWMKACICVCRRRCVKMKGNRSVFKYKLVDFFAEIRFHFSLALSSLFSSFDLSSLVFFFLLLLGEFGCCCRFCRCSISTLSAKSCVLFIIIDRFHWHFFRSSSRCHVVFVVVGSFIHRFCCRWTYSTENQTQHSLISTQCDTFVSDFARCAHTFIAFHDVVVLILYLNRQISRILSSII